MNDKANTVPAVVRKVGEFANKGDIVNRSTTVEGRTVTCVRTVKRDAREDQSMVVEWVFDFSGLTEREVLEMAARQAVIDIQAEYRGAKDKPQDWARRTFKYPLERERTTKTAAEKVAAIVQGGKLTDAEKAELLKMLQG